MLEVISRRAIQKRTGEIRGEFFYVPILTFENFPWSGAPLCDKTQQTVAPDRHGFCSHEFLVPIAVEHRAAAAPIKRKRAAKGVSSALFTITIASAVALLMSGVIAAFCLHFMG